MAASGNPFDGPNACPFVALELDRDRRSERPDYRHRCFAEPTPAPRSIAHQEAYCLSPNFAACPIFQDWALRAAARPVGAPAVDVAPSAAAAMAAAAVDHDAQQDAVDVEPPMDDDVATAPPVVPAPFAEPEPAAQPEFVAPPGPDAIAQPFDEESRSPSSGSPYGEDADEDFPDLGPAAAAAFSDWDAPTNAQQLGAFDEPATPASLPGALTAPEPGAQSSWGQPDAGYQEPPDLGPPAGYVPPPDRAAPPGYVPPPARRDDPTPAPEEAAVPAFLAGRAATQRPPDTQLPPANSIERVTREELVPSWEIDDRYGAERPADQGGGGRFDKILTAIAVIAILALGVAGVLFLPGLLAGGPGPSRTAQPTFALPSGAPTVQPSSAESGGPTIAPATAEPSAAGPTAQPTPGASPITYRIRNGDSLARIARNFDITLEELLAANPDITDPNRIFVGQVIIIPQP